MGLEKLLRGLYGTRPQLDMDRQFARSRILHPMTLDFHALAEGIRKNNVGVAGIQVQATGEFKGGRIVLALTGQSFPLEGNPPANAGSSRRKMNVLDWDEPAKTRVAVVD